MDNPNDIHYDTIYQKGSELQYDSSHTKELDFFYAAAGSMSDTEKDAGSGKVEGKGLVATVNSNDQISLTYYKADGTTVTKNGGPFEERDPVAVENLTIDEAAEAGQSGISLEAGKKLQLHTTIEPADATDYNVTWSSSDTAVATVNSSGQASGVAEGQATITVSLADSVSGETFTDDITVNVTPRTTSGTPYVLTNTLTPGKNYIIVSANSGDAYALMNDNGTISKDAVTIEGDTIYSDNEDIVFEAQGEGTTINDFHNGNRYLKASSDGLQLLETAGSSRPWEYNSSNHSLRNYKSGSNPSYYYVYYDNNAFTSVKSTTHAVYIFEETELPEDVTYNVTFKVENGKWNDDSSTDKTVQVSGPEGSVTLSADQIPAVGNKPNSGYKAGSWNVTPDTTTAITGNTTYTYTYVEQSNEKNYVLTNELKAGRKYIIASADSGTAVALANDNGTASTVNVAIDGDTIHSNDSTIVFTMEGSGGNVNNISNAGQYLHEGSPVTFSSSSADGHLWSYSDTYLSYDSSGTRYDLYYSSSSHNYFRTKAHDGSSSSSHSVYLFEEEPTEVSHTVTFRVENGKWNDDTTEEKTVVLSGAPGTELKLSADQIPAVGDKPNTHYKVGAWDVVPATSIEITEDTIYKYAYEFIEHDWSEPEYSWKSDNTEATATRNCKIEGCEEAETETVNSTYQIVKEPTCTDIGTTVYFAQFTNSDFVTKAKEVDFEALGHDMTAHPAVAATCTEAGNSAYWSCDRCNKYFSDENGATEIEENSWVISKLGHDYQPVAGTAQAATCTEDGKEADQKCSHCNNVIEGAKIDKLGHDYQPVAGTAQAATCTEDGKEADQKCSHCNNVIEGAKINKLGHDKRDQEGGQQHLHRKYLMPRSSKSQVSVSCDDKLFSLLFLE